MLVAGRHNVLMCLGMHRLMLAESVIREWPLLLLNLGLVDQFVLAITSVISGM